MAYTVQTSWGAWECDSFAVALAVAAVVVALEGGAR